MKKTVLILSTTLFLLALLFTAQNKIKVEASPETLHVPTQYPTIQKAINQAKPGDTVFVHSGTYAEHIIVNKTISLIGEDRETTIIDGQGTGSPINITSSNVYLKGFTVKGGTGLFCSGIFIGHSNTNYIINNKVTDNYDGICLRLSSHNVISDNVVFSNTNDGISLYGPSTNNTISTNTIFSNNNFGISSYNSNNNFILDNVIFFQGVSGITFSASRNNIVSKNIIKNNYYGVFFYIFANNNTVLGNSILFNNVGTYISDSEKNILFHNNFNNTLQAWADKKNFWDNGYEGNYWTTYKGNDTDSDGIGDTPYIIEMGNADNYPLMGMFSDFRIALMKETFSVATICNSTISDFRLEIGSETGNRIIRFTVAGKDGSAGFCRIMIPVGLMSYPYIVLVDIEEIVPTFLDVSNETHAFLYFNYTHSSHVVTIISSKTLRLYNEVLNKYNQLNATYYSLLYEYCLLLGNYSQLEKNYHGLLDKLENMSDSYDNLLINYGFLWANYSQLQKDYNQLNSTYQEQKTDYSKNVSNVRNLMYVFAALSAIFLITTVYLSKHAHEGKARL